MINFIKDLYVCWVLTVYGLEMKMIKRVSNYCVWRSTNICKRVDKWVNDIEIKEEEGLA